jgi:hypothetical protein
MSLATKLANAYNNFRQSIGRLILRYAPRYGSLDTIFHSYDDWRELQEQHPASTVIDQSCHNTPAIPVRPKSGNQRGPKPRHAFE